MKTDQDKIDKALQDADDECENANWHSQVGIARRVFESIKNLVTPEDKVTVARRISKAIIASI